MGRPKIAAVVPCYNVGRACLGVIAGTLTHVDRVIAVDDGSTDDTLVWLRQTPCRIVNLPVNQGKGIALRAGFRAALEEGCDYVVTIDGDGQHRPEEIPGLLAVAQETGSDFVVGVRDVSAMPSRSKVGNLLTRWFFRAHTGVGLPDTQTGFRLFASPALRRLMEQVAWGRYETEMDMLLKAAQLGMKVASAPISTVYIDNNRSSSFRTLADSLRVLVVVLRYAATGLSSALLELMIFSAIVLAHPERYGWALIAARGVSLLNHFLMSRFFAFRVRRRITLRETASYAAVAALNLAVSYALLHVLISVLSLAPVLAMVTTQVTMFAVTFTLLQRFTFRVRLTG